MEEEQERLICSNCGCAGVGDTCPRCNAHRWGGEGSAECGKDKLLPVALQHGIHRWDGEKMVHCGGDLIDYPKLLRKYMEHVIDCEGTSFAGRINSGGACDVQFTDSERLCLENIARQAGCMHMGDG